MRKIIIAFFLSASISSLVIASAIFIYNKDLKSNLENIENLVIDDLIDHSAYKTQSRLDQLKYRGFYNLYIYPIDAKITNQRQCFKNHIYNIKVDGLIVGRIFECSDLITIIKYAYNSPLLNTIILMLIILFLIFYYLPLVKYKKNIKNFIKNATSSTDIVNISQDISKDTVLKEIYGIIQSQIEFKISNDMLKINSIQNQKINDIARQLAHDIRSPLSALNMVLSVANELPEEKRLVIRSATQRINDIANNLLEKSKSDYSSESIHNDLSTLDTPIVNTRSVELLSSLIDLIVSEKRIQYRELNHIQIQIDLSKAFGLFSEVNATEIKTILSNVINNSVEAIDPNSNGIINISIEHFDTEALILIRDNGKGIPQNILSKIGEQGFSYGKNDNQTESISGSGLGIYHAKKVVKELGGRFVIDSIEGQGTFVKIYLPICQTPTWFLEKLNLVGKTNVISLDDDTSVHQIWSGRFTSKFGGQKVDINHLNFTSIQNFKKWFNSNANQNNLFLVDYEFLNQDQNGIELIEELNIKESSILVTSRYDEAHVREKCLALGIKMIPKSLVEYIPIQS